MRRKGRLQAGMDADIVVFDPATITDRASYLHSTLPSAGIRYVLVNGTVVVRHGEIAGDTRPGARSAPSRAEPGPAAWPGERHSNAAKLYQQSLHTVIDLVF